jgi:hypothetical protein
MKRFPRFVGCLAGGALLVVVPAVHAQSLADAAKKAQEEHDKAKTTPTPAKVYTNKDLKEIPASPPAQPAMGPTASVIASATTGNADAGKVATKTDQPPDAIKDPVKAEVYWRDRWTPIYIQLVDEQTKATALATRIDDLTVELSGIGPLNARRGGVETERQRLITQLQAQNDKITADKAVLAAIQEEGRRAGALPGWFR